MSTRSLIALKTLTGFMAIYNHFDGYPEGVGVELVGDYNSLDAVHDLMNKGNGSDLQTAYGDDDEKAHYFNGTIEEFLEHASDNWNGEYVYVWNNSGWRGWRTSTQTEVEIPGNTNRTATRLNQKQKIMNYLNENGEITAREALEMFGVKCLSARICELRNEGMMIGSQPEDGYRVYYLGE